MNLKETKKLYDLGFAIILLHPKSKRPIESKWTTGERRPWTYLKANFKEGDNIGVRLGEPSKIGDNYLACIDVDVKDPEFKTEALTHLKNLIGNKVLPEVRSGSGNGSRHLYCVTAKPFPMITIVKEKDKYEICIYSTGRQMVLPKSIHPNGNTYAWFKPLESVEDLPLMKFKAPLEKPTSKNTHTIGVDPNDTVTPLDFKVSPVDLDWLPISDKVRDAIREGLNVTDRSGYLLQASNALLSAGLNENEILSVLTDPTTYLGKCGYDHAQTKNRKKAAEWVYKYTLKKVASERSIEGVFTKASEAKPETPLSKEQVEKQNEELAAERHWSQELERTKGGKIVPTLRNLKLIFQNGVDGDLFVKDMFANRVSYGIDTPWKTTRGQYLTDIDLIVVKDWLSDNYMEPNTSAILEATSLIAHENRIHPVQEYLNGLQWDGTPRIDTWIKDYCEGEAAEPYLSEISRKFLLAMVKRVYEPGCQWDYVLVLEGMQGKYKSSIARAIASDKWFMDNLPDLKDKDSMLNLQGKWLIELGELTNVKRSDHNLVKAYLVRRNDTVRPHYGRIMEDVPRQSVFIGTVNEGQYLKDPTGNRRFWPVKVGTCDVEGLKSVRDQLFAEAVHIYKETNEVLMLSPTASKQATAAQEDRRIDDDETDMREALEDFMKTEEGKKVNWDSFRSRDLFTGVSAPWGPWSQKNYVTQTAAQVLRNLGFDRRKSDGQRVWGRRKNEVFLTPKKVSGQTTGHTKTGYDPVPSKNDVDFF